MSRNGPILTDTTAVALGLAQIRTGDSSGNITSTDAVLSSSDSIGALANTKFLGETDFFELEDGANPMIKSFTTPIRERAALECAFKEQSPTNYALAYGIDPLTGNYSNAHSGEIMLGARSAPDYIRMEAEYVFPNGSDKMTIIFPRAQVTSNFEIDLQQEEATAVPIVFESQNASSDVSGGDAVWDNRPLGRIHFE